MQLVLNELSARFPVNSVHRAQEVMAKFLAIYQEAKKATNCSNLILDKDYNNFLLAGGYCIAQWRNDKTVDIEDKRLFRSLLNFSSTYDSVEIADGSEFVAAGYEMTSIGCQLAYELSGCCLSFLCHHDWDTPAIKGIYSNLNETTDSIDCFDVSVPNLSSEDTLIEFLNCYGEQLEKEKRASFTTGKEILNRASEFPNLIFCKNAEIQLAQENNRQCICQIVKRLIELQVYFQDSGAAFEPKELNHCTPESEQTLIEYRSAHTFKLPNSKEQLFSWHLRFTGEYAGRIFIHPDMKLKKCFIGHIGGKLPTVKYN